MRHGEAAVIYAERGSGPLLQRDYWAVVEDSRLSPAAITAMLGRYFDRFAPGELVRFGVPQGRALQPGDRVDVRIRGARRTQVEVLHRDALTLTLGTVVGHPEAGRITFGAYRNRHGDVIVHIRSRARSGTRLMRAGFLALGEAMQTRTWGDFVDRVAATAGKGVKGWIQSETVRLDEDEHEARGPTFLARDGTSASGPASAPPT